MSKESQLFQIKSRETAFDLQHRKTISFNMSRYDTAVDKGKRNYINLELAKKKASNIKNYVLRNLPELLIEFEKNSQANGAKVLWARDAEEAMFHVKEILQEAKAKLLVKSKSMTSEEIDFNDYCEKLNVESVETDLGEYIVQIAGEKPYHIVTPAMHKSKEDVADLFNEKFGTPPESTPEFLTNYVRQLLRRKFVNADVGVTGANFLIADSGAIALTENEGNGLMSTSFPRIHIAIAGIEKIIPSLKDMPIIWPLLAVHGTGQKITVYNTLFFGPKKGNEPDGPEKMFVILLDNGRSELYGKADQHRSLKCIRCGACLNACPVYKNIGGYTFNSTYSGPIGSVITPHLKNFRKFKHLSFASSLCGKCSEVCPVKIDIHELLLANRRDAVLNGYSPFTEKFAMHAYKKTMLSRTMLDFFPANIKNSAMKIAKTSLGEKRQLPKIHKSFASQWKQKNANNSQKEK